MVMASKLQVKIYGKTYTVKETDSQVPVDGLAEYVDARMKELAGSKSKMGTIDVAILAALNIAQELMECKNEMKRKEKENEKVLNEIDQRAGKMAQALSRELKT